MRVVLQRVSKAQVVVGGELVGAIGRGYLLLVGIGPDDSDEVIGWMADKIAGLRLFGDEQGRMNLDLAAVDGGILAVSQFTLYGDASKGRRPSFIKAAPPEIAEPLFDRFVTELKARVGQVETGKFGAMMDVSLINDGPVTLLLERDPS